MIIDKYKKYLHYDKDSATFRWKERPPRNKSVVVGSVAGCLSNGYSQITLLGTKVRVHRLIWLFETGQWPINEIDHIDGDKTNNHISNLRDVTHQVNTQNLIKSKSNNVTGLIGAVVEGKKFIARVGHNGKTHRVGAYTTALEAHQAYINKKRELHKGNTL